MNNKIVVSVDGRKDFTKKFIQYAYEMGYSPLKINPLKLNKEISELYFPDSFDDSNKEFERIKAFTEAEDSQFLYVWRCLQNFISGEENRVAILVNTSDETLSEMKDEFGIFSVMITDDVDFKCSVGRTEHVIHIEDLDDLKLATEAGRILRVLSK